MNRRKFLKTLTGSIGAFFVAAFSANPLFRWLCGQHIPASGVALASPPKGISSGIDVAFGDHPLTLPYLGKDIQLLRPNSYRALTNTVEAMDEALRAPIGMEELFHKIQPQDKVAVCISDSTRSFGQPAMISALVRFLTVERKHPAKNIFFVVGNGNHAVLPVGRLGLAPEIEKTYRFINVIAKEKSHFRKIGKTHPAASGYLSSVAQEEASYAFTEAPRGLFSALKDIVSLNFDHLFRETSGGPVLRILMSALASGGTEVWMERHVADADWVISIGQIKPHPLTGFSGGAKGVMPGATARITNIQNHLLQAHPSVGLGKVDGNILRLDIEQGVGLLKNVSIFNVVLNGSGEPARFVAGDMVKAHCAGVEVAQKISEVSAHRTPLVVVANGTQGKIDLYQFSKSASTAACALARGGVAILCGELPDAIGKNMAINPAFAVKEVLYQYGLKRKMPKGVDFFCVSPNAKQATRGTFYRPFESIDGALSAAWKKLGQYCPATVIPDTDHVIPLCD